MLKQGLFLEVGLCMAMLVGTQAMGAPGNVQVATTPEVVNTSGIAPMTQALHSVGGQMAAYPTVKALQRTLAVVGPTGGIAIPRHFAGWDVPAPMDAQRAGTGTYAFDHTFDDGSALFYYSDIADQSVLLSMWHGYPGLTGGLTLSGAMIEGDHPSTSLSFSEDYQDENAFDIAGVSLWQNGWGMESSGQLAVLSRYRSHYGVTDYTYASEDHTIGDWMSIFYEGGGAGSSDGLSNTFWGDVAYLSSQEVSFACTSQGESLNEYGDIYHTSSDFEDSCVQLEAPFSMWESWSHTEYTWDSVTLEGGYQSSGTIICTNSSGEFMQYSFAQGDDAFEVTYVDEISGEEVTEAVCAWEPFAEPIVQ